MKVRPIRIEGDVAYVALGGKGNENVFAIIDATDAELVSRYNWSLHGHRAGARTWTKCLRKKHESEIRSHSQRQEETTYR